ncbi:MAG: class I SAM-dependent methyltransferase, partial [Planctomycetia bacterium]|nr:class I SAM-dependent methyltransferase [Planctomycetia bacterium]
MATSIVLPVAKAKVVEVGDGTPAFLASDRVVKNYLRCSPLSHALFRACEIDQLQTIRLERPVLDLGCGAGQLAQHGLEGNIDFGLDISAKQLAGARRLGRYEQLIEADAAEMPLDSGCMQSVLAFSSLEHMRRPEKIMAEVMRVLRPGGTLVATITLADLRQHLFWPALTRRFRLGWLGRLYVSLQDRAFAHRTMFPREEWERMANKAGLEIVVSRRILPAAVIRRWDALLPLALPYWLLRPLGIPTVFPWPGRSAMARWAMGGAKHGLPESGPPPRPPRPS